MAQNNTSQIKHVIQILSQEFALSQHPHSRKGGLIGLAACSIALGKVGAGGFVLACAGCSARMAAPPGSAWWGDLGWRPHSSLAPSLHCSVWFGLCLSLPFTPSHVPCAWQRFLAWVASRQLPRHGLSVSVCSLFPVAGLDSSRQVLMCVNRAEKRCSPSTSRPQLNRLW